MAPELVTDVVSRLHKAYAFRPEVFDVISSLRPSARGELEADLAANDAHGRFEAEIDAATVQFRDLELSGEVKLTIEIPRADLRKRTFDLAGTRLELAHFRSPQAESAMRASRLSSPGWWAEWTLDQGQVAVKGFGTFERRIRKGRAYKHPLTGESIDVANKETIIFKPSDQLIVETRTNAAPRTKRTPGLPTDDILFKG